MNQPLHDLDAALALAAALPTDALCTQAAARRDACRPNAITYSRKVFIPLTRLCRDVCHYCTFATTPSDLPAAYLDIEAVLAIARAGAEAHCHEALFTLGDRPEARYPAAARWLEQRGFDSTVAYIEHAARQVIEQTGLLPHINAGVLDESEYRRLRAVSASMGLMLESAAVRLCERGGPHFGSPDKHPAVRLESLAAAGRAGVPTTSGILIGIGETRRERLESLFALRALHRKHGHLQEIIVQNFMPKADTPMRAAAPAPTEDLRWTVAMARLILDDEVSLQVPPNLNPHDLSNLIDAGLDDWGGVSPVTPDHVNPEAPWPAVAALEAATRSTARALVPRLTIYPKFVQQPELWLAPALRTAVLRQSDASGFARDDRWCAGSNQPLPAAESHAPQRTGPRATSVFDALLVRATRGDRLAESDIVRLFAARGDELPMLFATADELRREYRGDAVTFVVNRNINYTNICQYHCGFCAFSKGKAAESLRGKAYVLDLDEVAARATEAWQRGATEVCMQGGIHPHFTGQTYLDLVRAVREAVPSMHVHAFSPLEITHGAATLGLGLHEYLERLQRAGLGSLPGTAAEILDDAVRDVICPDKLRTAEWLGVLEAAHAVGLRTTSTIMFGSVESPLSWARHLLALRDLQARTGGITEFVPLPFVHMEAPLYRRGRARRGPTFREAALMHAIARLTLHPLITNVQASWVKLGPAGAARLLSAGVNDLGGVLMNESISRAAGAEHGQELDAATMRALILAAGREPCQRTTLYAEIA